MRVERLELPELVLLTPRRFADDRGWFAETYNQRAVDEALGGAVGFVQDNHSRSAKGVLRGLHYQLPPHAQGKLVRVLRGAILDVAVDVRRSSPTFGRSAAVELSEESGSQLWIPAGFAHGFLALADDTEVLYKTTDFWAPAAERSIRWNTPILGCRGRRASRPSSLPRMRRRRPSRTQRCSSSRGVLPRHQAGGRNSSIAFESCVSSRINLVLMNTFAWPAWRSSNTPAATKARA
jgi:dTDP-4-dehydrorhamnose 3,5-epimerase